MVLVTGTLIAFGVASLPARAMDDTQLVESWYQRYLGRGSDPGGLNNWVWQLRSGMPPDAVEASILGSDEYYVRHGQTPEGFVAGLYQDVLSRGALGGEVASWVNRFYGLGDRQALAREFLGAAQAEWSQRAWTPRVDYGSAPVTTPSPVYAPAPVIPSGPVYAPTPVIVVPRRPLIVRGPYGPYLVGPAGRRIHVGFIY